ncbi:hypothetical protein, partial [Niabella terrae]
GYYYWLRRLSAAAPSGNLVAVHIDNAKVGGSVEITYPNGVVLNFSGELNASNLKSLICCI